MAAVSRRFVAIWALEPLLCPFMDTDEQAAWIASSKIAQRARSPRRYDRRTLGVSGDESFNVCESGILVLAT
jgi:hypothetical protein